MIKVQEIAAYFMDRTCYSETYGQPCLKRDGILSLIKRDFGGYAWSMRSLDHFYIRYTDTDATVEEVKSAVRKELDGPGKLLGYRAIYNKIRQEYLLNVPRNLIDARIFDLDPKGLKILVIRLKVVSQQRELTGYTRWMGMIS